MDKGLRVFISSSGLSALYLSIFAQKTASPHLDDVFLVDALSLKPSQRDLILQASGLHDYSAFIDMSRPMEEVSSMVPSKRKQLTRKLKTRPGFKQIYDFLYRFKLAREDQHLIEALRSKAPTYFASSYGEVQLHTQPVLHLNRPLQKLFDKAEVRYFEHGLGDYLDVRSRVGRGDSFYCVFAPELKAYYEKEGKDHSFIKPLLPEEGFLAKDLELEGLFPKLNQVKLPGEKRWVLVALQALEQFQVDPSYWDHFMQSCLKKIDKTESYSFLLKPHPRQDREITQRVREYLESKNLEVLVWDRPELRSLHMEILFGAISEKVDYVCSPFSSTVFYLSRLYPDSQIRYFYSLDSIFSFTQATPQLYIDRWKDLSPFLDEVFGHHAEKIM